MPVRARRKETSERTREGALASLPPLPERPLVSVVIPVLNEEATIGACLEAIEAQTYDHGFIEVVVADGGSTDGTRAIVAEHARASTLRALRLIDNPGRTTASGLNEALRVAGGEVIQRIDGHTVVPPEFIAANVRALRETGAAAVGGVVETRGRGRVGEAIALAMSHPFGVGDARFRIGGDPGPVDTVPMAAYRRACFERLGGFPEADKGEDDAFNFLVRQAGGVVYLDPRIRCIYYCRSTYRALAAQYFGYGRARGRALVERPRSARVRHVVPAAAVGAGGAALAAAPLSAAARWAAGGLSAAYGLLAAGAALHAAGRRRAWSLAPLTLLAFPVMHLSYGLGTLLGAAEAAFRPLTLGRRRSVPSPAAPR
jgi:succinoglycan biosynthesis protein ExoA